MYFFFCVCQYDILYLRIFTNLIDTEYYLPWLTPFCHTLMKTKLIQFDKSSI